MEKRLPAERPSGKEGKKQASKGRTGRPLRKPDTRQGKAVSVTTTVESTLIRLNRFIANSGVCSRRDADEHIKSGLITVNGKVITDLGVKVSYNDDVRFRNKRLSAEKKVYILMNKPKDYVTTVEDPHAEHTVLDLIGKDCPERVYPVGRLDKATTGVLLLTNDGELAGKLTHPKYKRRKIYHVFLDNAVTKNDLFKLTEGIELDGITVVADAVSYADPDDKTQIGIELHSGQNRVIRRMFETLGYKVKKLDRVYFAGLTKKNVPRGKWRYLNDKEISMLKRGIF
jgi:23S rRNA pseudouridine2605 synthase